MNLEAHLHDSERNLAHVWRRVVGELERSFRPRPTAKPVSHG